MKPHTSFNLMGLPYSSLIPTFTLWTRKRKWFASTYETCNNTHNFLFVIMVPCTCKYKWTFWEFSSLFPVTWLYGLKEETEELDSFSFTTLKLKCHFPVINVLSEVDFCHLQSSELKYFKWLYFSVTQYIQHTVVVCLTCVLIWELHGNKQNAEGTGLHVTVLSFVITTSGPRKDRQLTLPEQEQQTKQVLK